LSETGYISIREHPTHGSIGFIESFTAHQVINKAKPSIIKALHESGIDTVAIPHEDGLEGKGAEGNGTGREGKGAEGIAPPTPSSDQEHWPDPREYPTLKTVEQWAEQVMAPKECAAKWYAIRVSENWETQYGRPLRIAALPALFRSYATNWKANGAKFKAGQAKPSEQRLKL
jgi:hypothetical protein